MMKTGPDRNQQPLRLLIVDAVRHSRESLATYMLLQEYLEVVGETVAAQKAIDLAEWLQPDVVIMDAYLQDMDGFTATRQLLGLDVPPAVILLTTHHRMKDLLLAQEVGAVACIAKSAGVDCLLDALRTLSESKTQLNESQIFRSMK